MRTRGRGKDIPGRRNGLSKGSKVEKHEEGLRPADRLAGLEPPSKERLLEKGTDRIHVS